MVEFTSLLIAAVLVSPLVFVLWISAYRLGQSLANRSAPMTRY